MMRLTREQLERIIDEEYRRAKRRRRVLKETPPTMRSPSGIPDWADDERLSEAMLVELIGEWARELATMAAGHLGPDAKEKLEEMLVDELVSAVPGVIHAFEESRGEEVLR